MKGWVEDLCMHSTLTLLYFYRVYEDGSNKHFNFVWQKCYGVEEMVLTYAIIMMMQIQAF